MKVFVDTSAWLATEIGNDYNYKAAVKHKAFLERKKAMVFTNEYVLAETYTRIIYDKHLSAAYEFHKKIMRGVKGGSLSIVEIDHAGRENVWKELLRYADHQLSFIDATIVVQFKQFKLDEIFTFDRHFRDINLPTNLK